MRPSVQQHACSRAVTRPVNPLLPKQRVNDRDPRRRPKARACWAIEISCPIAFGIVRKSPAPRVRRAGAEACPPPGAYRYELRVVWAPGDALTVVRGVLPVLASTSRETSL